MGRLTCSRLRILKEEPHTQRIAEAAIGLGVDNGTRTRQQAGMDMDGMGQ